VAGIRVILFVIAGLAWMITALSRPSELMAQGSTPSAINAPDSFAWALFQELNADAGLNDGRVVWETWKSANNDTDIFLLNGGEPPPWRAPSASTAIKTLSQEPLQEGLRRREAGLPEPQFDPNVGEGNEVRLNRSAFEFVLTNELYHQAGQVKALTQALPVEFPIEAREIKAQWRRLTPQQDPARYHTAAIARNGVAETWGLTSLHITTKDLPNWFWATFEHIDNPDREAEVPSRDRAGLPSALKGTKWEHYALRGTQVDFTTARGVPTILASSQIERRFQRTSSCITCHARATIAADSTRLRVFRGPNDGFVGTPDPNWFLSGPDGSQKFFQMDFVWSLVRARRRP
jgi:hypothetical protein